MKICYINPTNNIRRPIAELANILAQEGHQISIMYPESKDCPTKNWIANETIKNSRINVIPIKSWYFTPLRYSFPNFWQLLKETKKAFQNNDKIHIWEYYYPLSVIPSLYAAFSKRQKDKIILTTDGFVGYSYLPKKPWWLVPAFKMYTQFFARFLFKIPRQMTTYGHSMLKYAKKAGVQMSKMQVIPTGIHLDRFENVDRKKIEGLRKEFNIEDEKVILFVGMLTERKGVNKVLQVSQQLLQEGQEIKTLLVGDAHGENNYLNMIEPEFKDKIIFTGGRKEIPEFMHLADVLFLPSEGEGLPGAVMEAMASGLPVVATKEGCTPDLIEDEKEGFLVGDGDYLKKVKNLLNSDELRLDVSSKAQEKIKKFEWGNIKKKYQEIYNN
ncbi:glycosyltransferase family 4 protein [Candidatus Woesearchaeota archaeon]|nr:glycosyltransferase family 4 protein [Candidatus Woesearchaeota archaeon]